MSLRLYNSLSKTKEEFVPVTEGKVAMYNCGPTVYDYAHIGNFRAYMLADLIRRYMEYRGLEVTQVMNITDVGHLTDDADAGEDKMEVSAKREQKDPWQIAELYSQAFFEDVDKLNIKRAHVYPRATEHIAEMIEIVQTLIDKGLAYVSNDCVYYEVSKFEPYGQLSGNTLDRLDAGARIEVNPDKRSPLDFTLWVTDPKHIMKWDSPWGVGYPGWHVECSAMSMKYLGETLDIHTGGEDNIFPHHECEIAQSEGATGKPFVKYWVHTRHLLVDGAKMSKSLGNFYTLRDLLEKGHDALAIRYLLLSTHYSQPLNFTMDGLAGAAQAVRRIQDFSRLLKRATGGEANPEVAGILTQARSEFEEALDDDLNISRALAAVFTLMREINKLELGAPDAAAVAALLTDLDQVLGILEVEEDEVLPDEIERLIEQREQARAERDFAKADQIRDDLRAKGIILEDGPDGVRWKKA